MKPHCHCLIQFLASSINRESAGIIDLFVTRSAGPYHSRHGQHSFTATQEHTLGDYKSAQSCDLEYVEDIPDSPPKKNRSWIKFWQPKRKRGMNVYVSKDGVWQKTPSLSCGVQEPIRTIISRLEQKSQLDHTLEIRIIRFRNALVDIECSRSLDHHLQKDFDINM